MTLQLAIKVRADSSVPSDLAPSSAALDQFGARAKASAGGSSLWAAEAQRSANAAQALRQSHEGVAASMATGARAAVLFAASLAAGKLLEYADTWTQIGNRLRLAAQDTSQMKAVQEQLFQAAQKAGVGMTSVVDVYSRASQSARELGASQEQLTRFSGGAAQAVALGGASAEAAAGALQQLGQALGSGTVHAEEFNSVLDGAPRIAQAVAAGLTATGGSVARLKEMINDGKVSSKEFFDAFLSQIPRIESEFGTAAPTMAQAMTTLQNAMTKLVGESNNALGVTATLAQVIQALGKNLDGAAGVAGQMALGLAAIGAARVVPTGIQALTTAIDDQRVALYAKAVATVEAANAEKLAAAQSLITAQRAQAATAATLAGAEAEFAAKAAAASSAAAGVTAAEVALTQARAKTSLTTNVYVANKALAAEREAQAAATAAREASIAADAQKVASLTRLRAVQAEAAVAGGAVAAANTHLTIAAEGAAAASGALAQRASLLSAAWGGVKSAGTALVGMLGGPWGAAFLAASGAVYYLSTRTTAADQAQDVYNRTLAEGRKRIDDLAGATRNQSAALLEKQRGDVASAQAENAKAQAAVAAAAAMERRPSARGLGGAAASAAMLQASEIATITKKTAEAAAAALDGMMSVSQKTGDAVGLELASKLARGTGAFSALDKATSDVMKSLGLTIQSGRLMSNEQADVEKSTQVLNRALAAGPGFLRSWGASAAQINLVLDTMRQKIDPVASAVADLNRQIAQMQVPDGAARAALTTLQQINQERAKAGQQPLTTVSPEYLTLLDKAKELETQRAQAQANARAKLIPLEEKIARAQAAGNDVLAAKLTREKAITEMEAKGVETAVAAGLAQQDFDVSVTAAGAAAGEAGKGFLRAADGQMRLAQAAGLGEAAARQAAYANKLAEEAAKGNGNVAAQTAANQREEAAAILTIRNETVRGLVLETANTNALTTAMAAGGEAVRVAQENEYKLGLIRKLGTDATVAGTAAQKALNDALDAYRANRAANDNNKLEQERRAANDNLALAQRELALMGEAEGVRSRALETMRNQQEAARKVAELGEEGARQWLAWQEQIADTRALIDFQKEVKQTSKSIADDLAAKMFDKGGSILDWWRNLLKRMAIEIASTQFIMPIVQQVVGAVPQLFGIQAPASVGGGQTATGGGLTNTLTNTALSKAGGWALDKLAPGGLMNGLDAWGYSTLGVGSASYGAPMVASNGLLTGGGATSLATPTGITGGLSGYFGAASAGAFGGALGGLIGTATNSKAIGGLSGAALGAGSAYLASALGFGALGGPVGLAVGAIVGGIMGLLGTAKKSVGPNSAANVKFTAGVAGLGDAAADNGGDVTKSSSAATAAAALVNGIVTAAGTSLPKSVSGAVGGIEFFEQGNKWISLVSNVRKEFGSAEEAVTDFGKRLIGVFQADGTLTGVNADVVTALRNSKATSPDKLLEDVNFASAFRSTFDQMRGALNPLDNDIKSWTDSSKALGEQIKTNILDWRDKAAGLGLATDSELKPALTSALNAMMGLGPAVEPLRGLAAVTKQAEINFEAFRPALLSLGLSADEVAAKLTAYVGAQKAAADAQIAEVERVGGLSLRGALDPSARLSVTDALKNLSLDPASLTPLRVALEALDASARQGAAATGQVTTAQAALGAALRAGLVLGDQYQQVVTAIASSWTSSAETAKALLSGRSAIETAINPSWQANPDDALRLAGLDPARVGGFAASWGALSAALTAGAASVDSLRASHSDLVAAYRAGTITLAEYQAGVGLLTNGWDRQRQLLAEQDAAAKTAADERAAAAKAANDAQATANDAQISAQRSISDGWSRIREQALAAVTSLRLDANLSTLGAKARLDLAESEMSSAYSRIFTASNDNDRDKAASDFNSLWRPYLEQSRAYYADQPEYQARQDRVLAMQATLAGRAGEQVDAASRALSVAEAQRDYLASIDARLANGSTGGGAGATTTSAAGSFATSAPGNWKLVQHADGNWSAERYATGAAALGQGVYQRPTKFRELGEAGPEAIMPLANIGGRLGIHAVVSSGGSAAPVDMTPVVMAVGGTSGAVLEIGGLIAARLDTMIGQNAAILRELTESRRINRDLVTVLERRAA
ncbi:hypothetical protein D3877_10395 [Azospirillum cavernae]|uniref:Tape measure protein N-terminal domain-containing protein n=1 Tax=Azospirillum cavernae TaxID=2320860 RepID=A0A418W4K1_9PROT|nr:tape measure protein [Azospirillum cavernae]RJF84877.1 hypothetical protein D3877_10395 [Azospirillum cavernae]